MPEDKRYYWIKLKTDFFDLETIDWLKSQENGCEYIVLYQQLCLMTANKDGEMASKIGEMLVPYDAKKIARNTKTDIDTVIVALKLFSQIGLIYKQENGIFRIPAVTEMVGSESASREAVKKREYRQRQKQKELAEGIEDKMGTNCPPESPTNCPTELELRVKSLEFREKSLDKERELYNNNSDDDYDLSTDSDNLSTRPVISAQWVKDVIRDKWKCEATENDITQAVTQLAKLNYQGEMLANALDLAAQHGSRAKNWNYVVTIIDNWINKGYKTEEDVLMHELNRKGGAR